MKDAAAKQAAFNAADREADLAWAAQARSYQARTAELTRDFLSRISRAAIPSEIVCWTEGHYVTQRNWRGKNTGREWVQSGPHQGWQLAQGGGEDGSPLCMLTTGEYFTSGPGLIHSKCCIYGSDGKLVRCSCTSTHRGAHPWIDGFPPQYNAANGVRTFELKGHYLNPTLIEQSMGYLLVHRTPIACRDLGR